MKPIWSLYVGLAILVAGGIVILKAPFGDAETTKPASSAITAVIVPALSPVATEGQELFNDTCAACHGDNGKGTEMGPPLIHPIYEPDHHADISFALAVRNGVRQHHWPYGDMPAQPHITADDLRKIVLFVREAQEANGITK